MRLLKIYKISTKLHLLRRIPYFVMLSKKIRYKISVSALSSKLTEQFNLDLKSILLTVDIHLI